MIISIIQDGETGSLRSLNFCWIFDRAWWERQSATWTSRLRTWWTSFFWSQLGRSLQKVQSEEYMSLIVTQTVKLSTTTFKSEAIVNSVQERSSATIKPIIIARSSAMLVSRAPTDITCLKMVLYNIFYVFFIFLFWVLLKDINYNFKFDIGLILYFVSNHT